MQVDSFGLTVLSPPVTPIFVGKSRGPATGYTVISSMISPSL